VKEAKESPLANMQWQTEPILTIHMKPAVVRSKKKTKAATTETPKKTDKGCNTNTKKTDKGYNTNTKKKENDT